MWGSAHPNQCQEHPKTFLKYMFSCVCSLNSEEEWINTVRNFDKEIDNRKPTSYKGTEKNAIEAFNSRWDRKEE